MGPVLALLFGWLPDLYQWERWSRAYEDSAGNLEIVSGQTPELEMEAQEYRDTLNNFAERTLQVMEMETFLWGRVKTALQPLDDFATNFPPDRSAEPGKAVAS
jgi:hypothetical protein